MKADEAAVYDLCTEISTNHRVSDATYRSAAQFLNEQQMDQWPAVQRRLYREKKLMRGLLSGESVNLFDSVRDMNLDERTAQRTATRRAAATW